MRYYPANLNLEGKVCIVFGGGRVAERKVKNILLCGGKVKVVSPELTPLLSRRRARGEIEHIQALYQKRYLRGASFAFAATSDRDINARIATDATQAGLLVNVCDSARESSFILPAVLRCRGITLAVSTDGLSPAKAVCVRDRLKEWIGEGEICCPGKKNRKAG